MSAERAPPKHGDGRDALAGTRPSFDGLHNLISDSDSTFVSRCEAALFSSIATDLIADLRRRVRP
jgi:hypothetical protein